MLCLALLLTRCGIHSNCQQKLFHWWSLHCGRVLHICLGSATALSQRVNPFRGKPTYMLPRLKGIPTYMSPKVKGYTDIYVILTYTGTETHVIWVIYTRNPLFRARVKIFLTSKRIKLTTDRCADKSQSSYCDYKLPLWDSFCQHFHTGLGNFLFLFIVHIQ